MIGCLLLGVLFVLLVIGTYVHSIGDNIGNDEGEF